MARFGPYHDSADRGATALAYSRAEKGSADTCDCIHCRNFCLARARVFPADFPTLLERLGIDPNKDGEVYHNGRVALGRHDYAGWFHFIGALNVTGDFPVVDFCNGFTAWMGPATAPRLPSLEGLPAVQLEFHAKEVPWLLDEPEPT